MSDISKNGSREPDEWLEGVGEIRHPPGVTLEQMNRDREEEGTGWRRKGQIRMAVGCEDLEFGIGIREFMSFERL